MLTPDEVREAHAMRDKGWSISVISRPSIFTIFLSILTPTVVWYLSANKWFTNCDTRLVFPTP